MGLPGHGSVLPGQVDCCIVWQLGPSYPPFAVVSWLMLLLCTACSVVSLRQLHITFLCCAQLLSLPKPQVISV